jgi:NADH:ubiquinone oxidoreductase subunit F (NADH-binding)/NAD-dependent dihydropyrimidine dehydrogenase PreA subunit/(2Fe-2S) ferredoxin
MKVRTRSDLEMLRSEGIDRLYPARPRIGVGMATCGLATGAADVFQALRDEASARGLDLALVSTGCLGYCQQEPLVDVRLPGQDRLLYARMTPARARELVAALAGGALPDGGALAILSESDPPPERSPRQDLPLLDQLPFYARQHKVILRNSGLIDPGCLEEYVARGGYQGLARAVLDLAPQAVVDEVVSSGLRGRGGGGFPTGPKWQICRDAPAQPKYLICNGDEGDPGAYMDRTVLESDPHSVIEGMVVGGYAIGAHEGHIYVRDEYPLAVERVAQAVARAGDAGLLGKDILGSGFDFQLHVVRGAGAFVCGEETALIASIEGGLGEPRPKPPYPATSGLWGQPTVINNVKTWASVSAILARGADWYAGIGVEGNRGTAVFSLVGKVSNTGLVEVPLGLSLQELIEGIGGGGLDGKAVKAVQTGGPSGGCLPARLFHLPIDYESLTAAGSIMGSGGMVVMDRDTCMVDVARYFLTFTMDESCGKCLPCREGTRTMHRILTRLVEGDGTSDDLDLLEEVANWVQATALCGLGQTAPNPVLTTLRYFRDEYEAHVVDRRCPAGTCRALIALRILPELCTGCGLCLRECPTGAITGETKGPHVIDQQLCSRCRLCHDVCPVDAIEIVR